MPVRDSKAPFAEFIEIYLATKLRTKELKPNSVRDYRPLLNEFDKFTGHVNLESALTLANARAWQREKEAVGLNSAINATMYLKSFAKWACKSGYMCGPDGESSVYEPLKAPEKVKRVRHALTQEQLDEIWRAIALPSAPDGIRATALLRIILATGLKREQTRTLLSNDFHPDAKGRRGRILVREEPHTKVGAAMLQLDAKTVKAIRDYLQVRPTFKYKGRPEPLLIHKDHIGFTENGFGSWIRRIAKHIAAETGIPWTTTDMTFTANEEKRALIHDRDLREKCTAALEAPEGEANLEDAVLGACKILEVRVRTMTKPPRSKRSGVALMLYAFAEPKPVLRFSDDSGEQDGFMRMYAGLSGVYRNRAFHEIRGDLDQRTARQIVVWVDHLLALLDDAVLQTPVPISP